MPQSTLKPDLLLAPAAVPAGLLADLTEAEVTISLSLIFATMVSVTGGFVHRPSFPSPRVVHLSPPSGIKLTRLL